MLPLFRALATLVLCCGLVASPAVAQERGVWVQVEALPNLARAEERVRNYAGRLDNVVGYALGSGWYAVALGPYSPADAAALARDLRRRGAIPGDSFVADGSNFRQQFWPVGVGAPLEPQPLPDQPTTLVEDIAEALDRIATDTPTEPAAAPVVPAAPDETLREAQASESLLSREEKRLLQTALEWGGFYTSTIDGLFGRGTRNSMASWQLARGYEATGVLTTRQRAELLGEYNAVLDGLDMARIRDREAGIAIDIPTGAVAFAGYNPPFAQYDATGALPVQVLLISQPGNESRLGGLYEILQTLEVVPPDGPRDRSGGRFTIEGTDSRRHTYIEAALEGGEIKGFALVWPAGDEERRTRVLALMRASFERLPGVLDPATATAGEDQSIDLVSGLAIRRPLRSRSGVYVDARGHVLTVAEAVEGCREVTVDGGHPVQVLATDGRSGLSVLEPLDALAPMSTATFQSATPRLNSEIAVAGYPFGGVLLAPALTFGTLADIRGLNGEEELSRLDIALRDGDAGGPVMDMGGAVIGLTAPEADGATALPEGVHFAVESAAALALLESAGLTAEVTSSLAPVSPERLTRLANEVTALVSCWE